jgi:ribosome-associated translation inhibitor RaiA
MTAKSGGVEWTESLRRHAERRLSFALGRLDRRVGAVTVRLSDLNGPRGGIDKECRIHMRLPRRATLVVRCTEADAHTAISLAAERAGRAVARKLANSRY